MTCEQAQRWFGFPIRAVLGGIYAIMLGTLGLALWATNVFTCAEYARCWRDAGRFVRGD